MGNGFSDGLLFYGERGLVNGLVLDLLASPPRFGELLRAAAWCGEAPAWTGELEDVTYLVEPGFSKFGQPDFVAVCRLRDGSRRYVVTEVKSATYTASAMSNVPGIREKAFNSSINGQMSLNYRFVKALERFDFKAGTSVEEPKALFDRYHEQLHDTNKGPRKLLKPQAVGSLVKPFLEGMNVDTTHFLVLARQEKTGPAKNPLETAGKDLLPLLLDDAGEDQWPRRAAQFGFLSLQKLDLDVLAVDGAYRRQCRVYLGPWDEDRPADASWPKIRTHVWAMFPEDMVETVDQLAGCIRRETVAFGKHVRHKTAHSFLVHGKVMARLSLGAPEAPSYCAWFSAAAPNVQADVKLLGEPIECFSQQSPQPFLMVKLEDPGRICDVVAEFLRAVATGA